MAPPFRAVGSSFSSHDVFLPNSIPKNTGGFKKKPGVGVPKENAGTGVPKENAVVDFSGVICLLSYLRQ